MLDRTALLILGPPTSGKTTLGTLLGNVTRLPVVDADEIAHERQALADLSEPGLLGPARLARNTRIDEHAFNDALTHAASVLTGQRGVIVTAHSPQRVRPGWFAATTATLRVEPIVVWIEASFVTSALRMEERRYARDQLALDNWDAYCRQLDTGRPNGPHLRVYSGESPHLSLPVLLAALTDHRAALPHRRYA